MLDPFLKERAFGVVLMDGPERKVSWIHGYKDTKKTKGSASHQPREELDAIKFTVKIVHKETMLQSHIPQIKPPEQACTWSTDIDAGK